MEICSNLIKPCLAYETVRKWIFKFLAGFRVQFHASISYFSWRHWCPILRSCTSIRRRRKTSRFSYKNFSLFSHVSCFCRVLPICLFMIKKSVAFPLLFLAAAQIDVNSQWKWRKCRNKLSCEFNPCIRSLIDVGRDKARDRFCWTVSRNPESREIDESPKT